jgi:hypothetical protein
MYYKIHVRDAFDFFYEESPPFVIPIDARGCIPVGFGFRDEGGAVSIAPKDLAIKIFLEKSFSDQGYYSYPEQPPEIDRGLFPEDYVFSFHAESRLKEITFADGAMQQGFDFSPSEDIFSGLLESTPDFYRYVFGAEKQNGAIVPKTGIFYITMKQSAMTVGFYYPRFMMAGTGTDQMKMLPSFFMLPPEIKSSIFIDRGEPSSPTGEWALLSEVSDLSLLSLKNYKIN